MTRPRHTCGAAGSAASKAYYAALGAADETSAASREAYDAAVRAARDACPACREEHA